MGVNFSRANLSKAILTKADLRDTNLTEADLSGAQLSEANLNGAILSKVNLDRAYLREADLSWVDLSGAKGATVSQVKAAKNWNLAFYSIDFLAELGLSPDHNKTVSENLAILKKKKAAVPMK